LGVRTIEIAGGEHLAEADFQQAARYCTIRRIRGRAAAPDIILCLGGKKVVPEKIRRRPGWNEIPAIHNHRIVEIESPLILQPGPAALTDGLDAMVAALWPTLRLSPHTIPR